MAPPPTLTTQATAIPPWWVHLGARLVRVMPAARYRAMNWICRRGVPPFIAPFPGSSGGLRFECDLRTCWPARPTSIGTYEPQETAIVKRALQRGGTFVDVGANWGYFTLLAATADVRWACLAICRLIREGLMATPLPPIAAYLAT